MDPFNHSYQHQSTSNQYINTNQYQSNNYFNNYNDYVSANQHITHMNYFENENIFNPSNHSNEYQQQNIFNEIVELEQSETKKPKQKKERKPRKSTTKKQSNQMEEIKDENLNENENNEMIEELPEIENNKENKEKEIKEPRPKWLYQDMQMIEDILQSENASESNRQAQLSILQRKVNVALLYYLLTECKGYKCCVSKGENVRKNAFVYVDKIIKGTETVFVNEEFREQIQNKYKNHGRLMQKKEQIERVAKIIENETGIVLKTNESVHALEFVSFTDFDGTKIDLIEFLKKYEQHTQLMEILNKQTEVFVDEMNLDVTDWLFQDPEAIPQILEKEATKGMMKETQQRMILTKVNMCMIYYLIKERKNFKFSFSNTPEDSSFFLYIDTIEKENEIVFDVKTHIHLFSNINDVRQKYQRQKYQMEKLAELMKKEAGIVIEFSKPIYQMEIVCIKNDWRNIDLVDFIDQYNQFDEVMGIQTNLVKENALKRSTAENVKEKWSFQDPQAMEYLLAMEKVVGTDKRSHCGLILKKLNIAMMYYIITECEGYKLNLEKRSSKNFVYLLKIEKNDEVVFDMKVESGKWEKLADAQALNTRRKAQIDKLSEIIETEKGKWEVICGLEIHFNRIVEIC